MKYVTVGQASIDRVLHEDGTVGRTNIGGPGVFGYAGIRLFDDDVQMILNTAEDFDHYYGSWIRRNDVNTDALYTCYDKTHLFECTYREDGSYIYIQPNYTVRQITNRGTEYGWTNVRPEQIDRHSKDCEGLYLFIEPYYKHFYKELKKIKDRNGFKVMYEIGILKGDDYDRDYIREILNILKPEMASLNHNEACEFFETENTEEIFNNIYDMGFDMFFYRCGNKGSCVLNDNDAVFVRAIDIPGETAKDPTGCGNTSTAAAMWAWLNTGDPLMTAILANIAAGFNVASEGVISDLSRENRELAFKLARDFYLEYLKEYPSYKDKGYECDPDALINRLSDR